MGSCWTKIWWVCRRIEHVQLVSGWWYVHQWGTPWSILFFCRNGIPSQLNFFLASISIFWLGESNFNSLMSPFSRIFFGYWWRKTQEENFFFEIFFQYFLFSPDFLLLNALKNIQRIFGDVEPYRASYVFILFPKASLIMEASRNLSILLCTGWRCFKIFLFIVCSGFVLIFFWDSSP